MFSKFAVGLTAVTVGAQFFFGKVRQPVVVQTQTGGNK
jgi:hypothetical protein